MTDGPILAAHAWPTNGHLIADVARLGYITGSVLDCTYGLGKFWTRFDVDQLREFVGTDLVPSKCTPGQAAVDFRDQPWPDGRFDTVVFDPDYKLEGTNHTPDQVRRYGLVPKTWQERMEDIRLGVTECCRVAADTVLVKCQDQVCSGAIRWQTLMVIDEAAKGGFVLHDRFDMLGGGRPQPSGRRQVHAHQRPSTLLVFSRTFTVDRNQQQFDLAPLEAVS